MDASALHACFAATLDSDVTLRKKAELELKNAEKAPGFINACLDIVMEDSVSPMVRTAAAIYLKNKVSHYWSPSKNEDPQLCIDIAEKPGFREKLIPALVKVVPVVRSTLAVTLHVVVANDFPREWPELLDITIQLFQSNDILNIRAGLTCLLEIVRFYRWISDQARREELDRVVQLTFPGLLNIAGSLVNEQDAVAGEMLKDVFKIYKMATYIDIPVGIRGDSETAQWLTLFLTTIKNDLPTEVLDLEESEREVHPWVKCKKWASWCISRLFSRYATGVRSSDKGEYKQFASVFLSAYTPQILETYLQQLQLWIEGKIWIPSETMFNVIGFMEHTSKNKSSWLLLKPHVESLISHVIFPLLCPTDSDLELFEDEPEQYIHRQIDVFEESDTPDIAATAFLVTVMRKRKKSVFNSTLSFVQSVVADQLKGTDDLDLARKKDGALRMLCAMSGPILDKDSPIGANLEPFIVQYVFPDFKSPHAFLRARVCAFINRFAEAKFTDKNNIAFMYQSILQCMNDEHMPVQIEASLAMQPLISHDDIKAALSEHIPQVMQHLLKLGEMIDIDALSGVMEDFVEVYSEQLTPFAVQLATQLRDQFIRLATEILEKRESDDLDDGSSEDKIMAAVGVLTTLSTLLMALDSNAETVTEIQEVCLPIFGTVLQGQMIDFYTDVFSIIETVTYCLSRIDPSMWDTLKLIGKVYETDGALDYLDEMEPVLQNYIAYGKDTLSTHREYVDVIYKIYETTMLRTDRLGGMDRNMACDIATRLMLALRGSIDDYVGQIVSIGLNFLQRDNSNAVGSCLLHLHELLIAGIYYNPVAVLAILDSKNFTQDFFRIWAENINRYTRVYDKKIGVLALLGLLSIPDEQYNQYMSVHLPFVVEALKNYFETLPAAIKKREDINQANPERLFYENGYDENVWAPDDDDDESEEEDVDIGQQLANPDANATSSSDVSGSAPSTSGTVGSEYINFLEKESAKVRNAEIQYWDSSEEDGDLHEEIIVETPIDDISAYLIFRDTLMQLSQVNQVRYQHLIEAFNHASPNLVSSTVEQANNEIAKAALGAGAGAGPGPGPGTGATSGLNI